LWFPKPRRFKREISPQGSVANNKTAAVYFYSSPPRRTV
jgi:hypothetical protein